MDLHASRDASLQIQNVSARTLTFSLHLHPLSSPPASPLPFCLVSSPRVILHPAEITTIAVSYRPALLAEDNALIIIEPLEIQHAPCVIPLVGFGGRSQPVVQTRGNQLFVTNNGDRAACFFVMGIEQNVVTLVKNSTFLPPIFYLPSMMEFSVKLADLRAEMIQKKVPIFGFSFQIPPCLYIFACDNILRRRLLQAHNRKAFLFCPSPRHGLLLALTECSSESSASTRSLLFTKTNLSESNIDISRDLHDNETLCDLDSRLGQEKTPKSHYWDIDALSNSLVSCRILFADLNETPRVEGTFRKPRHFNPPAGKIPPLRNSLSLGLNDPNDPNALNGPNGPNGPNNSTGPNVPNVLNGLNDLHDPNDPNDPNDVSDRNDPKLFHGPSGSTEGTQHFPRVHDHSYKCQFTDPYDQLEAQQKLSAGIFIGSYGDQSVQISPSMLRLSLGSPEETLRVLNMISRDVDFHVSLGVSFSLVPNHSASARSLPAPRDHQTALSHRDPDQVESWNRGNA